MNTHGHGTTPLIAIRHQCRMAGIYLLTALLIAAGCVSSPLEFIDNDVLITLYANDQVDISGHRMTTAQAVRRLRSHPVSTDTAIKIRRTPTLSSDTMGRMLQALQRAGYTRVIFVGERHIDVETQESNTP